MTNIKKARTSAVHQQLSDGEQLRGKIRGENIKSLRTSDYVSTDTKISIKLMTKDRKATVF